QILIRVLYPQIISATSMSIVDVDFINLLPHHIGKHAHLHLSDRFGSFLNVQPTILRVQAWKLLYISSTDGNHHRLYRNTILGILHITNHVNNRICHPVLNTQDDDQQFHPFAEPIKVLTTEERQASRIANFDASKIIFGSSATESQKNAVIKVLESHKTALAWTLKENGQCNLLEVELDTGDTKPITLPPYRPSLVDRAEINKQIRTWLECGIVEISNSNYSFPML